MFVQNRFLQLAAGGRLALLAAAALLYLAQPGMAQVNGTPTNYNVTVNEFSLCADSNCASKASIISSASAFDLAGATPGASAGDYVPAGTTIPSGTYSHFLIKIGQSVGVVGRISNVTQGNAPGVRDCITDNTTANLNGGVRANGQALQLTGGGTPGTTTFTIPAQNGNYGSVTATTAGGILTFIIPFAVPITVNDGEAMPAFEINFDITNAISGVQLTGTTCDMFLGAPVVKVVVNNQTLATLTLSAPS